MVYAHVIYKKTGLERKVLPKAYELIKKSYTLLGYVDENGDPVDGPVIQTRSATVQKKRVAEPVASEPRKKLTPEEIEAKKAELRQMNEAAIKKVKDEQAAKEAEKAPVQTTQVVDGVLLVDQPEVKERKKPGPKPKIKNEA